jgi:hypothetical protein
LPSHPLPEAKHRATTVALAIGLGFCLTAPFWLTNIIWYKNPVYPSLSSVFPSEPWSETARYRFEVEYAETNMWSPQRDWGGLLRSVIAVFDFSLLPNDWARFHGHRPVFGSLFTLLLPLLFVLKNTKRIWIMVGWVHLALFCWYWVHHQDRYLQAVLPLMAAITASILILTARQLRRVTNVFIGSLVGVQLALGADVYFIATHAMTGSAIKRTIELIGMGHQGKFDERFVIEPRYVALSRLVPEDARILFHDMQSHLGSEREAVRDVALWQSGINYSDARHPNDIHRWLQALGVTHIVVNGEKSTGGDRLSSDLLFLDFAYRRTKALSDVEGLHVFELPTTFAPLPFNDRAVIVSCSHGLEYSIFHIKDLARPSVGPLSKVPLHPEATFATIERLRPWLSHLDFLVVGSDCDVDPLLIDEFRKVAERPKRGVIPASQLFIRKS